MDLEFTGDVWHWRGPSPYYFVTVPVEESVHLHDVSTFVTYGWGMIPVRVRIGATEWETSLFPKDGGYVLPVKDAVRRAEELGVDGAVGQSRGPAAAGAGEVPGARTPTATRTSAASRNTAAAPKACDAPAVNTSCARACADSPSTVVACRL